MKVEKLIELLSYYNKDSEITNEQLQNFIHIVNLTDGSVILSTTKPIGECIRTGGYVYPSIIDGYSGFSPELNEDLYDDEYIHLDHDKFLEENNGE